MGRSNPFGKQQQQGKSAKRKLKNDQNDSDNKTNSKTEA